MAKQASVTKVTFEEGYEELKSIVEEVDNENITVHDMCEKFARGKGLEQALRAYLDEQEGKLKEVEEGEGVPDFKVVAPSKRKAASNDVPADGSDFGEAGAKPEDGSSDDIPF